MQKSSSLGIIALILGVITCIAFITQYMPTNDESVVEFYNKDVDGAKFDFNCMSPCASYIQSAHVEKYDGSSTQNVYYYVRWHDGNYITFTKTYWLHVTLQEPLSSGSYIYVYCRVAANSGSREISIYDTTKTTKYGSYSPLNSAWGLIKIEITGFTGNITSFMIHGSGGDYQRLYVDYVYGEDAMCHQPTVAQWHDQYGNVVSNYSINVYYNITTTSNINTTNLWLDASIYNNVTFQNGSEWYTTLLYNDITQVPATNTFVAWYSPIFAMPPAPPFPATHIIMSLTFQTTVSGTILGSDQWVVHEESFPNIRQIHFYWY